MSHLRLSPLLVPPLFATGLLACSPSAEDSGDAAVGIPALGAGTNDLSQVRLDVLGDEDDDLATPRDLAFDPEEPGRLWVVNQDDDSVSIFLDAGTEDQTSLHIIDPYAMHFMEEVSSIAFGAPGTFGTCQESRNTYNGQYQPNDFMGPSLWSSDLEVFGESNPAAVEYLSDLYGFSVDLGSHLDMQHESPQCVGIAWERDNRYWVFDGQEGSVDMVDFHEDHGVGFDDHSDGETATYMEGELDRVANVHSGMVLDHSTGLLYVADTGNSRVIVLDTTSGEPGDDRRVTEPGTEHYYVDGEEWWTLIDGEDAGLVEPSGLALLDGVLYVADHAAGAVVAFEAETGAQIDRLDLDREGIMGLAVVSESELWMVDAEANELLRLLPAE